jgi:hypothetical protein
MALFGDLLIHLSPHLPAVSCTNVFNNDISVGFLLLYSPCAMYHPPLSFLAKFMAEMVEYLTAIIYI